MVFRDIIGKRSKPYLSIGAFLAIGLASLVAVPLVVVFAVSLGTAISNTNSLLEDRARLLSRLLTDETRAFLGPAEAAPTFVAGLVERDLLDADDPDAVARAIQYTYAAAPQLNSVVFAHEDGWTVFSFRDEQDGTFGVDRGNWKDNPVLVAAIDKVIARGGKPGWSDPVFISDIGTSVVSFAYPVLRDGRFHAAAFGSMRLSELSKFIKSLSEGIGETGFLLLGREGVLAHRSLVDGKGRISPTQPIPRVSDVGDPVLASIWSTEDWAKMGDGPGLSTHRALGGTEYMVFTIPLDLVGTSEPWLVGGYVDHSLVTTELRRLGIAAGVGGLAIVVAVAAALMASRRLSRPVIALAEASDAVRKLELEGLAPLPRSSLLELDRAAMAFNRMVDALRLFSRYVPRRLVEILLDRGGAEIMTSREREATIMFTDLAGFSRMAETMTADACARFLNAHLSLLTACIEAEGGTVDKFIGDAVMAFWVVGPDGDRSAQPAAAIRAALAIRAAIAADQTPRDLPIHVRVGIHTGRVILGNLGTATRLNFTIVGGAVNIAQRIEAQGKQLADESKVTILFSAATAALLPPEISCRSVGLQHLQGVETPLELFTIPSDQPVGTTQAAVLAAP